MSKKKLRFRLDYLALFFFIVGLFFFIPGAFLTSWNDEWIDSVVPCYDKNDNVIQGVDCVETVRVSHPLANLGICFFLLSFFLFISFVLRGDRR